MQNTLGQKNNVNAVENMRLAGQYYGNQFKELLSQSKLSAQADSDRAKIALFNKMHPEPTAELKSVDGILAADAQHYIFPTASQFSFVSPETEQMGQQAEAVIEDLAWRQNISPVINVDGQSAAANTQQETLLSARFAMMTTWRNFANKHLPQRLAFKHYLMIGIGIYILVALTFAVSQLLIPVTGF